MNNILRENEAIKAAKKAAKDAAGAAKAAAAPAVSINTGKKPSGPARKVTKQDSINAAKQAAKAAAGAAKAAGSAAVSVKNESRNRSIIRMTESDLHRIIRESVKRIINEKRYEDFDDDADWNGPSEIDPVAYENFRKGLENSESWHHQKNQDDYEKLYHGYETEPEWYRNHNVDVSTTPGRMAMNAMTTDEEDPEGTIRDISRSYNGTWKSMLPAAERFANRKKK